MTDNNDPQSPDSNPSGWHPTQLAYKPEEEPVQPIEEVPPVPPLQQVVQQPVQPPATQPSAPPTIPPQPLPIQPPQQTIQVQPTFPAQQTVPQQAQIQIPQQPTPTPTPTPTPIITAAPKPEVKPPSKQLPPSVFDSPHSSSRIAPPQQTKPVKQKRNISLPAPNKSIAVVSVAFFLVFGVIGTYYSYQHMSKIVPPKTKLAGIPANKPQAQEQKVLGLIEKVSKKVDGLPTNETPSVATITDLSKLQNKVFFAKAQKGDKLLIYATAKKAILFRPSTNKIIQESPVELVSKDSTASDSAENTASSSAEPVLKIKY